jgi:hypothetical protein
LLERALRIMEAHYGQQPHKHVAMLLSNLSETHAALGDAESAAELQDRAEAIRVASARS